MKPSLASTPPAWLANIFPGLNDPIDTTDYDYEELVARRLVSGWPPSWVRDAVSRLEGGGAWEDRLLRFVDHYAACLDAYGWCRSDLFPESEMSGMTLTRKPFLGTGWPLLDALDTGGVILEVTAKHILYANARKESSIIRRER